ncbi:unnamed protein product [Pleuronectes platessa]|uniref:Uncharacterized protein n=1 Tax=Pleuronectes platessa TaxID=8262 RepID=A0A9N7Z6U0_PLEPL|nr:unnamed protein product [Pleuronectes platessa]
MEGGGKRGRQWRGKGPRGWDGRNKGACRGVMVHLGWNELKMDAAADVQTAVRQSCAFHRPYLHWSRQEGRGSGRTQPLHCEGSRSEGWIRAPWRGRGLLTLCWWFTALSIHGLLCRIGQCGLKMNRTSLCVSTLRPVLRESITKKMSGSEEKQGDRRRIPSLSGPVTRGNLRTPEGEAGEKEPRKGGRTEEGRGSGWIKRAGREASSTYLLLSDYQTCVLPHSSSTGEDLSPYTVPEALRLPPPC